MRVLLWALLLAAPSFAQSTQASGCSGTPAWSSCDIPFDLMPGENPETLELRAEFRSPHHRTYALPAFRDGERGFVIRVAPTEEGEWDYRLTSNLPRLNGQEGNFTAAASSAPGFVRAASLHHFRTEDGQPHLWMATAIDGFLRMPRADFDRIVDQRAQEKFTHLRVTLDPDADLHEAAERVRAINAHGLVADLVLASIPDDAEARRKYISAIAARFSAMNITWMGLPSFEKIPHGRAILKDAGQLLKQLDPYDHLRSSMASQTSAPLASDQWETLLSYGTTDPNVCAVEHQFYGMPAANTAIQTERDLWNATMDGQYPASGSGQYMTAWFDFMSANRYWELEPYFDVKGGRAVALEGVEYIVYVEKPGPVEVTVANHGYDVSWINPATGERVKEKGYKGKSFMGEPPDTAHDWVLHISREGHKESMLKSYKFESRGGDSEAPKIQIQEIETNPQKTPFNAASPADGEAVSISHPAPYSLKTTRNSPATQSLLVEWAGEVTKDGEGYRIIGTGREGTFQIPPSIVHNFPALLGVHVWVLNAFGKAYEIENVYRLTP